MTLATQPAPAVDPTDSRVVRFPTGAVATFPFPVDDVLVLTDAPDAPDAVALIVQLGIPPKAVYNQNVFGVRRDGLIAWQISNDAVVGRDSPYVGIELRDGRVYAGNWSGLNLYLDPTTGAVLDRTYTK